jgi:hypothetical protein
MARVDDGMLIRVNGQKGSPYVGSESLRIIVEETGVRFAIVTPSFPRSSEFPEGSNSVEHLQGTWR